MTVQYRKSKAQDEAREARARQRAVAEATRRLWAYVRGERAAVERRDVELVLRWAVVGMVPLTEMGGSDGEAK